MSSNVYTWSYRATVPVSTSYAASSHNKLGSNIWSSYLAVQSRKPSEQAQGIQKHGIYSKVIYSNYIILKHHCQQTLPADHWFNIWSSRLAVTPLTLRPSNQRYEVIPGPKRLPGQKLLLSHVGNEKTTPNPQGSVLVRKCCHGKILG